MKYKVTETICDYDGKPLKVEKDDLTWRTVIHTALNSKLTEDAQLPKEKVMLCYDMTRRAFEHEEVEFSVSEVAFLLDRILKTYNKIVVGRAEDYFNKKNEIKKEEK